MKIKMKCVEGRESGLGSRPRQEGNRDATLELKDKNIVTINTHDHVVRHT